MVKDYRRFLVMILTVQLVAAPMLQASIAQVHAPSKKDSEVITAEVDTASHSESHSNESHDQCDEINGSVDRCASCFCIGAALLSREFKMKDLLNQAITAEVPKFNLYNIYLIPPFRPPIS